MEATTDWYAGIEREISSLKEKISGNDYKLYEVDLLLRAAKRMADFSSDCEQCQAHRNDISNLVTDLGNLPEITKDEVTNYGRTFRNIIKHIEKYHRLRRSVPNPLILIGIALPILLMSVIFIGSAGHDVTVSLHIIAIAFIGSIIAAIVLIVGVVFGIIRLFTKST